MPALHNKTYLGDAVYASHDGYHIWLTTENGLSITNEIALDPHVLTALWNYVESLKQPCKAADVS